MIAEPTKTEAPTLQSQMPPQTILAPPPVPGMPLPPGMLPFPRGFPVPGLPPPGIMPPFGMGIPPPCMPPGLAPPMPENIKPQPMFDQRIRPDGGTVETSHDVVPHMKDSDIRQNQGQLPVSDEPDNRFQGPNIPDQGLHIPRPGFVGNRPGFNGMRPRLDGARPGFDGLRPGFEGPRREFDGHRPRLDGPRPGFGGPPPWGQHRPRFPIGKHGSDREHESEGHATEIKELDRESDEPSQNQSPLRWKSNSSFSDKDDGSKREPQGKNSDKADSDAAADDRMREKEDRDRGRDRGRPWDRERDRGDRGGRGKTSFSSLKHTLSSKRFGQKIFWHETMSETFGLPKFTAAEYFKSTYTIQNRF